MPPHMVRQFSAMLNSRFARWDKVVMGRETSKSNKIVRETITYPTSSATDANNPCLDATQSFEHVLKCGHLVTTARPNEPCAPNCYHVDDDADLDRSWEHTKAMKMKHGDTISDEPFYCDACVEIENEKKIPAAISSSIAEARRAVLRATEAKTRKKAVAFRKCYIALKITSVQCHSDGTLSSRYVPTDERHPFDTAMPRTGENMYEDVDPDPIDVEATVDTSKMPLDERMEDYSDYNSDDWGVDSTHALGRVSGNHAPALTSARHSEAGAISATMNKEGNPRVTSMSRQHRIVNPQQDSRDMTRKSMTEDENDDDSEDDEDVGQLPKRLRITPVARRSGRIQKKKKKRI